MVRRRTAKAWRIETSPLAPGALAILTIAVVAVIHSCGDGDSQSVNHASSPEELSQKTNALIADILKSGATADADSGFRLEQAELVKLMYEQNNNQHIWAAQHC